MAFAQTSARRYLTRDTSGLLALVNRSHDDESGTEDDHKEVTTRPPPPPPPLPPPPVGPPSSPVPVSSSSSSSTLTSTPTSMARTTFSAPSAPSTRSTTSLGPSFLSPTTSPSATSFDSYTPLSSTPVPTSSSSSTSIIDSFTTPAVVSGTSSTSDFYSSTSMLSSETTSTGLIIASTSISTFSSLTLTPTTPATMGSSSGADDGSSSNRVLVITLSTVLSVIAVVVITILACLCYRRRLNRTGLFKRGITPIDDDEIATWKVDQVDEKRSMHTKHDSAASSPHHRKTSSLIQYQAQRSPSLDAYPQSPQSFVRHQSLDLPQPPLGAVLAKAPNARSGLTDDAIPGDDPFVIPPRRNPSKLAKQPSGHYRTRTSRSSSIKSVADAWVGENSQLSPPLSSESSGGRGHSRVYSTSTAPPHLSYNDLHHELLTGLSPPPTHRTEVGRAIG